MKPALLRINKMHDEFRAKTVENTILLIRPSYLIPKIKFLRRAVKENIGTEKIKGYN